MVEIYIDLKCRGIYQAKTSNFLKIRKCHLVGTLCTIYKHFGDFVKCIFTILLQIQRENHFLPTGKH